MTVLNPSREWQDFIDPMIPEVVHLVVTTWDAMKQPPASDGEDDITTALCRALQQNRTARGLMFQIRTQVVELEPAIGEPLGRMDIVFIPLVPREDIYFCLESKRLRVMQDGKLRTYASEYVSYGMARFVTGQYSRSVKHGGMIGYVLDGDTAKAMSGVEANIQNQSVSLGMVTPAQFEDSSIMPSDRRVRETHHKRANDQHQFCIHHLFMGAAAPRSV